MKPVIQAYILMCSFTLPSLNTYTTSVNEAGAVADKGRGVQSNGN